MAFQMRAETMKPACAAFWFLIATCASALAGGAPLRTWTSGSGAAIEAVFVEERGHAVVLRDPRGALVQIRTDQLTRADQDYVASLRPPIRYIFFHVASTDRHLRWDQGHPASFTRFMFDDLLEKVAPAENRTLRVGLSFR
jgi:hypothetical protein